MQHQKLVSKKSAALDSCGLSPAQLLELQQKLFQEARERTLSGPLPAAAPEAPQQQQQQQAQQQQQQQREEDDGDEDDVLSDGSV